MEITVSNKGAEIRSLKVDGLEYMWNGDSNYWGRVSPILFPIVGKLKDDILRINGNNFLMKQHGFARDTEFIFQLPNTKQFPFSAKIVSTTNTQFPLVCRMVNDDSHSYSYPYNYELSVAYHLQDKSLVASWEVKNVGTTDMYFQIGAHPAFMLPNYRVDDEIHGYLQCFDSENKIVNPIVNTHLIDELRHRCDLEIKLSDFIPITNTTFSDDAILIEDSQVQKIILFDKDKKPVLSVSCPQSEAFGIWAPNKKGCPFICIEPWCGISDSNDFNRDISERKYIHRLVSGGGYLFSYKIDIL